MHRRLLGLSTALRATSGRAGPSVVLRQGPATSSNWVASRPISSSRLWRSEKPVEKPASATTASEEATASEAVVAGEKSDEDPLKSGSVKEASSSSSPPSAEPTASEAAVAAEKSDVEPLAAGEKASSKSKPAPTASEATVAAEKSDVDPLAGKKPSTEAAKGPTASEDVVAGEKSNVDPLADKDFAPASEPAPTASEDVVAGEKSEVDPLKDDVAASSETDPKRTASEDVVAGEKSNIDPLASTSSETISKSASKSTKKKKKEGKGAKSTASKASIAAGKSSVDPLALSKGKQLTPGEAVLKRYNLEIITTASGTKQLSDSAPTTPSGDIRALRTEKGSLLVREYVDMAEKDTTSSNATIAANTDPFARFDPTFLRGPADTAIPYAPRQTLPAGKKYGIADGDEAYKHLAPISYFAVWPNLAARPLARTILEEATRLELGGEDRKRVMTALDKIKYSTIPSDMAGALRNPDGQKTLRVVLLHRHDTFFAPDDHVIRKIWDKYGGMAAQEESPDYEVEFDYMLWDDRATVIAVKDVRLIAPPGDETDSFFQDQQIKSFWRLPANTENRFFMELSNATRDTTYPIDLFADFMRSLDGKDKASMPEFGRWGRKDLGSFLKLDGLKARGQFRGRVWDYADGHEF